VAGGNVLGGLLSGQLYGKISDKFELLRIYLVENGYESAEAIRKVDDAILFKSSMDNLHLSAMELNGLLYDAYHPGKIWLIFGAIGLFTGIMLFLYNRFLLHRQ